MAATLTVLVSGGVLTLVESNDRADERTMELNKCEE